MRRHAGGAVLAMGVVMLCASGCAKHELVKKDEGIAPAASTAKPPVKTEVIKAQPVKQAAVKESPLSDSTRATAAAEALQSALQRVYFDFDSYKLSDAARATLAKNAEAMKKDPADKVRIEGNCDERGSDEYNLALGERRARTALDYLVTMGVPADRLSFISYGKEKPLDPAHAAVAWAKNRRDDFTVVKK